METVGLSGSDLGINTKGREGSKFAQELNCDAGQRLSQPSSCSPGWGERDESFHSHVDQSFTVDCLRKRHDMTAEAIGQRAAFQPQAAGVISPSFSKGILPVHYGLYHRSSL